MNSLLALLDSIPLLSARDFFAGVERHWCRRAVAFGMIPIFSLGMNPFGAMSFESFAPALGGALPFDEDVTRESVLAEREILWLARAIYSESKIPEEQLLVAWVIRNRVESDQYPDTYEGVVLQWGQFSGLHATDKQYWNNISLNYDDTSPAWDSALEIADAVYFANGALRPLGEDVLHFYSPISVKYNPTWATGTDPVHIVKGESADGVRFAFYAGIK